MFKIFKSSIQKIKKALDKTRKILGKRIKSLFSEPLDATTFDRLEQILYEADIGIETAEKFVEHIKKTAKKHPNPSSDLLLTSMKEFAHTLFQEEQDIDLPLLQHKPSVFLIVGVNGSGKTTSCAKMAAHFKKQGKSVLLAAGDTFRAAAIDQLSIWADKVGVNLVKGNPGGDPSSVIYDGLQAAVARDIDVVIADTAGRLQSKTELMEELSKIRRVCQKVIPDAPHEIYLVIDATTGQNAIDQAKVFHSFTPLTGIVLTKLDGSAKGGIALAIYDQLHIPIQFIGVGEKEEDLLPFNKEEYIDSIFESS